jgi:O-methyltransferase
MKTWLKTIRKAIRKPKPASVAASTPALSSDLEPALVEIIRQVQPFTMTSPQRIASLCDATRYVIENDIPGDFVECGVWRGGSAMAMSLVLNALGIRDRQIWLYDTYAGMTPPTNSDVDCFGYSADQLLKQQNPEDPQSVWCYSQLAEVQANMARTGYPIENCHFVAGPVEQTIPQSIPKQISLLRLDTDWYESTRHELVHLYPRLTDLGVLIIDDYGHWQGCRQAVDEYFDEHVASPAQRLLLHRVDYTGRIAIKPAQAPSISIPRTSKVA